MSTPDDDDAAQAALPDLPQPVNKGGRPRLLQPDEKTLTLISGLRQLFASVPEVAAVLHVSETTLRKFLTDFPEAREAFDDGFGIGRVNLRRKQIKLADKNAIMGIFLGKNYLDQTDKQEFSGPGGGAIPVRFESMTNAQLASFLGRLDTEITAREGAGGVEPPQADGD
jgi:hypothetical protein